MAFGQLQDRLVTPFTFDVATLTGKVATAATFVDTLDTATDGTYLGVATTTDGGGTGATFDVVITANAVDTVTLSAVGSGYAAGDTLVIGFASITGAGSGTVASTVATVLGEVATVGTFVGGTGWLVGDLVTAEETSSDGSGTGFAATVLTAAGGVPTELTITAGGVGYAVGDTQTYIGTGEIGVRAGYLDHDEYELGGVVSEYTSPRNQTAPQEDWQGTLTGVWNPSNTPDLVPDDNDPTITTVLLQDQAQLIVQKKMIDGGTVTVYAEPTLVDANGNVVGNTVRAEDYTDEARCIANGFTWKTGATGDAGQATYGYCSEVVAFDATLDKAVCIYNGYLYDDQLEACVNADGTDEAVVEAYLNGGAGDAYTDGQKQIICKFQTHFWNGSACVAAGSVDFGATYTTQATCKTAGGLWLAGTCYAPESFGNGQAGDYSETVGTHNKTIAP